MKAKPPPEPIAEELIEEALARAREVFGTAEPPDPPKKSRRRASTSIRPDKTDCVSVQAVTS